MNVLHCEQLRNFLALSVRRARVQGLLRDILCEAAHFLLVVLTLCTLRFRTFGALSAWHRHDWPMRLRCRTAGFLNVLYVLSDRSYHPAILFEERATTPSRLSLN